MKKISLVVIAKNEEKVIGRCLKSAKRIADEIIVVDTGSTDRTIQIAKENGAMVYEFPWEKDFSKARNFGLEKAQGEWILILDADEELQKHAHERIMRFIEKKERIGQLNIVSKFERNGEIRYSNTYVSRLFPRGILFKGRIHEQLDTDLPRINTQIKVFHDGYFHRDKSTRNIEMLEKEIEEFPRESYLHYQLGKEYRNQNENEKAIQHFKISYRYASENESFFPNLIVEYLYSLKENKEYLKAVELIEAEERKLSSFPDFHFAIGLFLMEFIEKYPQTAKQNLPLIEQSYLKCLALGENHSFESVQGTGSYLAAYNLGVYYEILGEKKKAQHYYKESSKLGYNQAKKRYNEIKNT